MSDAYVEMIEIDDLPSSQGNTSSNIIIIDETHDISSTDVESESSEVSHQTNDNIYHPNKLLNKVIKICLSLEHSEGMSRVINKYMLSLYDQADLTYKNSEEFKNVLKKVIYKLQTDPYHKFSHMKNLCENLKSHKYKKRVKLVTLATHLGKTNGDLSEDGFTSNNLKRKHISSNKVRKRHKIDVIDLDDELDAVIDLDSDNDMLHQNHNCDKENNSPINNNNEKFENNTGELSSGEFNNNGNIIIGEIPSEVSERSENCSNEIDNSFLVPVRSSNLETPLIDETKVKQIEEEIAACKKEIFLLDEEEVCDDSTSSPYIKCEKYKARIVELYKQLCRLTGDEPVKRREVRLQVLPGRPAGPVKNLEEYLNDNIGENGEPPFPDFHDVVTCVAAANHSDNLGWNAVQVMNEANALFTQCGRALQKRRQQRDWRDILGRVNLKDIKDPADEDPELMARLEENKRLAQKKEEDVIEMFSHMGDKAKDNPQLKLIVTNEQDSCGDSEDEERSCVDVQPQTFKLNDVDVENKNTEVNNSKIKLEPLNISSMLDELGDDYSTAILEVIDPFMVIEISSDSEDEDGSNEHNKK